jgi:hypothetical protein
LLLKAVCKAFEKYDGNSDGREGVREKANGQTRK